MHVFLHIAMPRAPCRCHRLARQHARGPDDHALGHIQGHVKTTEIGIELAVQMKLVHVPAHVLGTPLARQFQYPDLGIPLAHQVETAEPAGTRHHARQLVKKFDIQGQLGTGSHRFGQVQAHHGAVGFRTAIGLHEGPGHINPALADRIQTDETPLAVLGGDLAAKTKALFPGLGEKRAAGSGKGIEVQMQVDRIDRLLAAIAPAHPLLALDGVRLRIQTRLDGVADHLVGKRGFVALTGATPGIGSTGHAHGTGVGTGQRNRWNHRCLIRFGKNPGVRGHGLGPADSRQHANDADCQA